ncbi:hypothetical protein [Streptomyces sp. bgisy084]|uniref:hypothetical protein n=1 Tax=Streptomyces sp. bgisy084 TaxID=3413777 RepID=UPI003D7603BF
MSTGTVRDDGAARGGTPAAAGGLQQGLRRRHMRLIALGGVIGAMAWLPDSRSQFWLSLLTVAVVPAAYELRRRKGPADAV